VLSGAVPAAVDQLGIARKAPDASFYDLALIDARERELSERVRDEKKEKKENKLRSSSGDRQADEAEPFGHFDARDPLDRRAHTLPAQR
ncbi:MAG: peptidase, partial [Massilia sp.]|nr:peptidase [Massilia sp.]